MKLMTRRHEINIRTCRSVLLRPITVLSLMFAITACSPRLRDAGHLELNPVEILERSPRIYHIKFEEFADSIETARATAYLGGNIREEYVSGSVDDTLAASPSGRELAILEYAKAKRRFEVGARGAALEHVRKALEADRTFRPPYILLGKLLLLQGRLDEAQDLLIRVVSWDVTDSEALLGLAKCYMRRGELDLAKKALIDAIIFNRVNLEAWNDLHMIGRVQEFTLMDHDLPTFGLVRKVRGRHYDLVIDQSLEDCPTQATAWIVFASQRAVWRYEGKFKQYTGETRYLPTYEEDVDCYMALAAAWEILAESDSSACDREYLHHISRVAEDGYLVPHVLFDYVCLEHPFAARAFSTEVIGKLRDYVNAYVLVSKG